MNYDGYSLREILGVGLGVAIMLGALFTILGIGCAVVIGLAALMGAL